MVSASKGMKRKHIPDTASAFSPEIVVTIIDITHIGASMLQSGWGPGDINTMYRIGIEARISILSWAASKVASVSLSRARMAISRVSRTANGLPKTRPVSTRWKVMREGDLYASGETSEPEAGFLNQHFPRCPGVNGRNVYRK